ncbi:uncharacterized protein LOC144577239 [Callithrix jacchus]
MYTDRAAAMTGWLAGFTTQVKEVAYEYESMHCVIHGGMLSSCKVSPELNYVLQGVIKIISHNSQLWQLKLAAQPQREYWTPLPPLCPLGVVVHLSFTVKELPRETVPKETANPRKPYGWPSGNLELFLPFLIHPSRWPQSPVSELPRGAAGCRLRLRLPVDFQHARGRWSWVAARIRQGCGRRLQPHRGLAKAARRTPTLSKSVSGQEELKFCRTLVRPGTVHSAGTLDKNLLYSGEVTPLGALPLPTPPAPGSPLAWGNPRCRGPRMRRLRRMEK